MKNVQLEKDLKNLRNDYAHAVDNCDKANIRLNHLEAELAKPEVKRENYTNIAIETLQQKVNNLNCENMKYRETIRVHAEEKKELENDIKINTEISNKLNKQLSEVKTKNEKKIDAEKKFTQLKLYRGERSLER